MLQGVAGPRGASRAEVAPQSRHDGVQSGLRLPQLEGGTRSRALGHAGRVLGHAGRVLGHAGRVLGHAGEA